MIGPAGTPRLPAHIGMATSHLEHAMAALSDTLGLEWSATRDVTAQLAGPDGPVDWQARVADSVGGSMPVELLMGSPGSTWTTTGLAVLHHYAYWSDDLVDEVAALTASGWNLELTLGDVAWPVRGFAYLTHRDHPRIELISSERRPKQSP